MKKVFSNSQEVSHIWASRSQNEGRANSIFFEKETIYSYGRHFPIAKFYDKKDDTLVLFNANGYSVTTAKHKSIVLRAINHHKIIFVKSVEGNHETNIQYLIETIQELKKKTLTAKKHGDYFLGNLKNSIKDLKGYCLFFNLAVNNEVKTIIESYEQGNLITKKEEEKIKEQLKIESTLKREKTKERKQWEKEEQEKILNQLDLWKKGLFNTVTSFSRFPIVLRIKDNKIETSLGASVSLKDGIDLYNAIKQGLNVEGYKIGVYTVNRIFGGFIKIGCHNIELTEIDKIFSK